MRSTLATSGSCASVSGSIFDRPRYGAFCLWETQAQVRHQCRDLATCLVPDTLEPVDLGQRNAEEILHRDHVKPVEGVLGARAQAKENDLGVDGRRLKGGCPIRFFPGYP